MTTDYQGERRMSYEEHHYRSADGLSLYYREYGAGDDVVLCLHGLTRNSKDFDVLARRLATRYRVICPDVRGRGRSERDPKPRRYLPGTYVRDIWRLLDSLSIQHPTVIGTSMGGLLAMIMADQQPDRLRGVVMNDIGPEVPPEASGRILAYVGRMSPPRDWDEAAAQTRTVYETGLPGMPDTFWKDFVRLSFRADAEGKPEPDFDPMIGDILRNPPRLVRLVLWLNRHGLVRRAGGMALDPWDAFRAMTVPCLVIHGAISDVLNDDIVRRMREAKPDLEVVEVPGRGHAPLLDEPEAIAAIDAFLERVTAFGS